MTLVRPLGKEPQSEYRAKHWEFQEKVTCQVWEKEASERHTLPQFTPIILQSAFKERNTEFICIQLKKI